MKNWNILYPLLIGITIFMSFLAIWALPEYLFVMVPGIVAVPVVLLLVKMEKKRPFKAIWNEKKNDQKADLIRTFLTLPTALKVGEWITPILFYYPLAYIQSHALDFGTNFPIWMEVMALLLISEFFFYWIHRWSHEKKSLWIFHAVHHGAERVYWGNAGRFHFVDAFLTGLAYAVPILVFSPSKEAIVVLLTLSAISGFMEHINIRFNAGIWNYVFNTAELHRWHHSEEVEESNTNYGKILVVWDLVFGTHYYAKNQSPVRVGVKNEKVPTTYLEQTVYPFRLLNKQTTLLKSQSELVGKEATN